MQLPMHPALPLCRDVPESWVHVAFTVNFFVAASVPLPKDPQIRQIKVLEEYAKKREVELGFQFLDRKQMPLSEEDDLVLWQLDQCELTCCIDQSVKTLPQLPGDHSWKLTNPADPDCRCIPEDDSAGPFDFACHSLFQVVKDQDNPAAKWPLLDPASPSHA